MTRDPLASIIEDTFKEARRQGMSVADTADVIAQVLRAKMTETELEGLSPADTVHVQSIMGANTGAPYVQCQVGMERWQWEPKEAREHAFAVLEAAEAAIHDAAVYRWLTLSDLAMPSHVAAQALGDLRRFRGDVPREHWKPNKT